MALRKPEIVSEIVGILFKYWERFRFYSQFVIHDVL
jgi:hypothetical protein